MIVFNLEFFFIYIGFTRFSYLETKKKKKQTKKNNPVNIFANKHKYEKYHIHT